MNIRSTSSLHLRLRRQGLRLLTVGLAAGIILGLAAPRLWATADAPKPATVHVVRPGETLWALALSRGVGEDPRRYVHEVLTINGLTTPQLHPGQRLVLPPK